MPTAGNATSAQGEAPAQASDATSNPGERAAPQAVGAPKSKSRWPLGKDTDKSGTPGAASASPARESGAAGKDRSTPIAEKPISLDGESASTPVSAASPGSSPSTTDAATAAIPVEDMPQAPRSESSSVPETDSPETDSPAKDATDSTGAGSGGAGKAAAAGAAGAGGLGIGALVGAKSKDSGDAGDPDAKTQAFSQPQKANDTQAQAVGATGKGHSGMTTDNANNQTTAFPTAGYNYADFDENTQAFDNAQGFDYDGSNGQVAPTVAPEPAPKPVRGTADFGLFILRVVVAALLGLHSLRIVFGLFGGPGFDGMTEVFSGAGFDQAQALSYGFGIAGLVAAVILLLGILTPIGATILLALVGLSAALTLASAGGTTILGGSELSGAPGGGLELHILYAAALLAILFAGGGRWGLDAGRKWAAAPKWSGFLGIIVAVAAVVVLWYLLNGSNPLST